MVGRVADREDHTIADHANRHNEMELAEFLDDRVQPVDLHPFSCLPNKFIPRHHVSLERKRQHIDSIDRAPLKRLREIRIGLRKKLEEHLNPLELGSARVQLCGLKSPHQVWNNNRIHVVDEGLEKQAGCQLLGRNRLGQLLVGLRHLKTYRPHGTAAWNCCAIVLIFIHFLLAVSLDILKRLDVDTAERPVPTGHLQDGCGLLGLLQFLHQIQKCDAGGFAIKKRVGGNHVLEQLQSLFVLGQFHKRGHHRKWTSRLGCLLLNRFDCPSHGRQFFERCTCVALQKCLILFT